MGPRKDSLQPGGLGGSLVLPANAAGLISSASHSCGAEGECVLILHLVSAPVLGFKCTAGTMLKQCAACLHVLQEHCLADEWQHPEA